MALCIQRDNPTCEAQDNYRGLGWGQQSFILPLPTNFWLTEVKARQRELVEVALAAAAHRALLLPIELGLALLEQLGSTEQPPAS